jgi:hypothetical protein
MLRSFFQKTQIVETGFLNRQMLLRKKMNLLCMALTALIISGTPAWAFDSSFPDNTIYVVNQFESGFQGGTPGAWGANNQMYIIKETFTFMADGSFTATLNFDNGLNRSIGADGQGGNTFATTFSQEAGSESGTYSVSPEGVVTVTFTGEETEIISGTLSENGQTIVLGEGEYNDSQSYASFGIGVGVKKGSGFSSTLPDNTTYFINEFENGFHGGSPGAWGANDQLYIVEETITFMADGTFTGTHPQDDGLNRLIGTDGQGGNTFTTTFSQDPGPDSGTYSVTTDGVVTVNFAGEDADQITGVLSADGQTVILGYSEYDDSESYSSFGIGVGVKKGSGFSSVLPDNTTYFINEFESGFHGGSPGAWGANDQLYIVEETITFMADGTFTGTHTQDDGLNRLIGADGQGGNTFTTTFSQVPGPDSGSYSVTTDGVVTVNFAGEDEEQITGVLSADGRTIIFGYGEYDNTESYSSFGIGMGVKKKVTPKSVFSAIFLLLNE